MDRWFTIDEAARIIARKVKADTHRSSVFRWMTEGALIPSVLLPVQSDVTVFCRRPISEAETHTVPSILEDGAPVELCRNGFLIDNREFAARYGNGEVYSLSRGVYELPMLGDEFNVVLRALYDAAGGSCVANPSFTLDGAFIADGPSGTIFRLMEKSDNSIGPEKSSDFYPALELPADALVVIESSNLERFVNLRLEIGKKKSYSPKSANSLLQIAGAACHIAGIRFNSDGPIKEKRETAAAKQLSDQISLLGGNLGQNTVKGWLDQVPELLPKIVDAGEK
ncbi:MAG: hypothetical protein AAGA22_01430 [Pseudomonadota bacterium]